ncbi:hypothetical protein TNCV_245571 [Trichonephila clavipes]|nr:hypothetical protein TNCV_245571 [Trichonephila clavipes]
MMGKRLARDNKYRPWTVNDWKKVFFSDETHLFVQEYSGMYCGSLEVKVTDSWPVCHELKPSTAEVRKRFTLNLSKLKRPHVGVE